MSVPTIVIVSGLSLAMVASAVLAVALYPLTYIVLLVALAAGLVGEVATGGTRR